MNNSTKLQIDIIMKNFSDLKSDYIQMKLEKNNLEETANVLNQWLINKEQQKCDLITMFKKIISHNRTKIQSLQKENSEFQIRIQEQNEAIEEYTNKIKKLKEEVSYLKEQKDDYIGNQMQALNGINQNISIPSNSNNFNHPSFENFKTSKKVNRKPKHSSQFRWTNLDIMINGGNAVNKKSEMSKKRKLYCPEDSLVEINSEEDY